MTPEISCAQCRDHLPEYVSGALEPALRERVERHLEGCASCRAEAAMWRGIASTMGEAERRIPAGQPAARGWDALRAQIATEREMEQGATPKRKRTHMPYQIVDRRDAETRADATGYDSPVAIDQRRPSFARPIVAVAAVLLLGLLSAALFNAFAPRGTPQPGPGNGCTASRLKATLPPHASVTDLAMTSASAGWAVGAVYDSEQYAVGPRTFLLRYADCAWTPVDQGIQDARLDFISMGTPDDGWAVGATVKLVTTQPSDSPATHEWDADQVLALHYTAGEWRRVAIPAINGPIMNVPALRMVSADEGWMLVNHGGSESLLHYRRGAWTNVSLPFKPLTTVLWGMAAISPDDVWLAGMSDGIGVVARYSGGKWAQWSAPSERFADVASFPSLSAISLTSPRDVWAVGSYSGDGAGGAHVGSVLLHYDGTKWSAAPAPDAATNATGVHPPLTSISAISPSEAWAFPETQVEVPYGPHHPLLALHYTGGEWRWQQIVTSPQVVGVFGLTMTSATQGWTVGAVDKPLTGGNYVGSETFGRPLFYENGTWTLVAGDQ
jgi:hypothetical protein